MTKNQYKRLTNAVAAQRERPARELMRVPKSHRPEDEPLPIDDGRANQLEQIFEVGYADFGMDCLRVLTCEPELELTCSPANRTLLHLAVRKAVPSSDEMDAYCAFLDELDY